MQPQCENFYVENIYTFGYPGIGAILMYMAIEGVAVMALIILIEVGSSPLSSSYYIISNNDIQV